MATIRKRGSRYNVQIRKEGYPSITKTFTRISVARKWAKGLYAKTITDEYKVYYNRYWSG